MEAVNVRRTCIVADYALRKEKQSLSLRQNSTVRAGPARHSLSTKKARFHQPNQVRAFLTVLINSPGSTPY